MITEKRATHKCAVRKILRRNEWLVGAIHDCAATGAVCDATTTGILPNHGWPLPAHQVWIERTDLERAARLLDEHDNRIAERENPAEAAGEIPVSCDDCHQESHFPSSQRGSVQTCSHCGSYIDVGNAADFAEWDESEDCESRDQETPEDGLAVD